MPKRENQLDEAGENEEEPDANELQLNVEDSETRVVKKDSEVVLLCKLCNKLFDNLHRLQRHMLSHDMNPDLRKFKCDFCNKAFKFKHHLKVRRARGTYYFYRGGKRCGVLDENEPMCEL